MPHKQRFAVTTRTINVDGMVTTLSLEDTFWRELEQVAREHDLTLAEAVSLIENSLDKKSKLSSALRAYLSISRVRH